MKKVSIITPNYNRSELLGETAESVLHQTYSNWEWIIVDDGSNDKSMDTLFDFVKKDARIKVYQRQGERRGACICRNQGFEKSTGEYLLFLDSDDLLESFCLENRVKALSEHPYLDFGIFPSLLFRNTPHDLQLWWNIDKPQNELIRQFHQDAICQTSGILIKREAYSRLGQWDEDLFLWQDIDMFFRAYIQGFRYKKFFDFSPDLHIRRLETSLSRSNLFTYEKQMSRIIVIKRAISLLKRFSLEELVPEGKYMAAEVFSGLVRTRRFKDAREWLDWCISESLFTVNELSKLRRSYLIYKLRLYRFLSKAYVENLIKKDLIAERTLGTISYEYLNPQK